MDTLTFFLALAAAFLIGLFVRSYLPTYFTEKGKNLATKEDIGAITKEIEEVKVSYAKELESIKAKNAESVESLRARLAAALQHQNFVLQRLAEIELNGIHSCWRAAANAQHLLNAVRPHDESTDLGALNARINELSAAHNTLLALLGKYDPFLDPAVRAILGEITKILRLEISQSRREPFTPHWWAQGDTNRDALEKKIAELRTMVQVRIVALREVGRS